MVTRTCTPNGPAFLTHHEESCPKEIKSVGDGPELTDPDNQVGSTHDNAPTANEFLDPVCFSSWTKLLCRTSWILRFVRHCRKPKEERQFGSITMIELSKGKEVCVKKAQAERFSSEIRSFKSKTEIPRQSKILSLSPFLDGNGVLRAGGRLSKAPIAYATRHPIILPQKHDITKLILIDFHERLHHEGNEHVRNVIRQ